MLTFRQGKQLILLGGIYNTPIHPSGSGTEGNPITYVSADGDTATITGDAPYLLDLGSRQSYIVVKNIDLYLTGSNNSFLCGLGALHILLDGIHTAISGPDVLSYFSPINYCHQWEIKNCYLDAYTDYTGFTIPAEKKVDLINLGRCSHFYIHDNYIGTALHSPFSINGGCSNFWVTHNVFGNHYRHGMNIQQIPVNILVENNLFENIGIDNMRHPNSGERRGCHSIEFEGDKSVIRNNIFTKDDQGLSNLNSGDFFPITQNWIYHNTYYGMMAYSPKSNSGRSIQLTGVYADGLNHNRIINNIFYHPDNSLDMYLYDGGSGAGSTSFTNNEFENNILVKADGTFQGSYFGTTFTSVADMDNSLTQFRNNIQKLPGLADPENADFHLSAGSPAINAGRFLAAISAINGNQLTLGENEAYAFTTSWGIPEKPNDPVYSNHGSSSTVISIDAGNKMTIADASGFSVGDSLTTEDFQGVRPDIGAIEFSGEVGVHLMNEPQELLGLTIYPNPSASGRYFAGLPAGSKFRCDNPYFERSGEIDEVH